MRGRGLLPAFAAVQDVPGGGGGGAATAACVSLRGYECAGVGGYGVGRTVPPWVRPVLGLGRDLGVGARLLSCPCHCWD